MPQYEWVCIWVLGVEQMLPQGGRTNFWLNNSISQDELIGGTTANSPVSNHFSTSLPIDGIINVFFIPLLNPTLLNRVIDLLVVVTSCHYYCFPICIFSWKLFKLIPRSWILFSGFTLLAWYLYLNDQLNPVACSQSWHILSSRYSKLSWRWDCILGCNLILFHFQQIFSSI